MSSWFLVARSASASKTHKHTQEAPPARGLLFCGVSSPNCRDIITDMSGIFDQLMNRRKREDARVSIDTAAARVQEKGLEDGQYSWLDSGLDEYSSHFPMFETFEMVIPRVEGKPHSIRAFVESALRDRAGRARGLELGGVGARLFRGFSEGFFSKTAGVTLVDERSPLEQATKTQSSHKVFECNIFSAELSQQLERYFGTKIDFIIERMGKGMEYVPADPYIVGASLQTYYRMLSNEGIMLMQVPVTFRHLLPEWKKLLVSQGIGFEYDDGGTLRDAQADCPIVFLLRKRPGSPLELPLLTPRQVHEAYKGASRL